MIKAHRSFLFLIVCCLATGIGANPAANVVQLARQDASDKVVALVQDEPSLVNQTSLDGTTALHWAVYNNNERLVKTLIRAGAEVNVVNDYGVSPLSEAAQIGNEEIINHLLKAGADVESANPEGQTALMTLARGNHLDAAKLLIKHGAEVNAREQWRGQTALMWASAHSQPAMVQLLIKHGADVDARSNVENWERRVTAEPRPQNRPLGGFTPLLLAAREGCADCVAVLIKAGADINLTDPNRITPLLMALLNGRFDGAKALIEAGADVNRWDMWGRAPLYAAVDFKTVPQGGRPDRPSLDDTTPLTIITMLLQAGANPNMQLKLFPPYRSLGADRGGDSMLTVGTTPLIRAAKAGDVDSIALLLQHGALPNLKNWPGYTPMMAAAGLGSTTRDTRARYLNQANNLAAAKVLLAAGAEINAADERGRTPLHGAASWGWNDMVSFLIENGAKVGIKDSQGNSALDYAEEHPQTKALLQTLR